MGALRNLLTGNLPIVNGTFGTGISSPVVSTPTTIHQLAWSEFFQGEVGDSTRSAAMQVPAISRARSILVSVIAGMPLRVYDAAEVENADRENRDPVPAASQPAWLTSTSGPTPVWHRMAWTIDDILFYGASLWTVQRDGDGQITDAARVPRELWEVDEYKGEILVESQTVPASSVIYIPGADEGLLAKAAPSIKGARAIERAWIGRVQNPIPLTVLHQAGDDELEDEEVEDLLNNWSEGRNSPTGALGYLDNRVNLEVYGEVKADLFESARNASVLDLARHTNMPAALLDGSMSTATLTYSTTEGKGNEFHSYSTPYYTDPIHARLSQDDITAPGSAVRFDRKSAVRLPQTVTAPLTDD